SPDHAREGPQAWHRGSTLDPGVELGAHADALRGSLLLERGYSLPSTASLAQMITALDVSADVLIGKRPLTARVSSRALRAWCTPRPIASFSARESTPRVPLCIRGRPRA